MQEGIYEIRMNHTRKRHSAISRFLHVVGVIAIPIAAVFQPSAPIFAQSPDTLVVFDAGRYSIDAQPEGWTHILPVGDHAYTNYTVTRNADGAQLRIVSGGTGSWLECDLGEVDVSRFDTLSWVWQVNELPDTRWENDRKNDDFAIRIELVYDFRGRWFPLNFMRKGLITALFRGYPPEQVISYVWSRNVPPLVPYDSPSSSRTVIIPIESDTALAGRWVSETRDIHEDFKRFVPDPDRCVLKKVRIRSDTDNTGSVAQAALRSIILTTGSTE